MNQTPLKYTKFSDTPWIKSVSKSVQVNSGDKRATTATFIIDLASNFLLMQLIYGGKTDRRLPKVGFPKGFSLSANPLKQ